MRKLKFTKEKLYSTMYAAGIDAVLLGGGTFLTSYVAMERMDPLITSTSIGILALGSISAVYSNFKQNSTLYDQEEDEYDIYEDIYNLDYLKLKRKELKQIESRFYIEQSTMDKELQFLIKINIEREKLLIKKAMESLNTDNPVYEDECDLIIDVIIENGFDDDYIEYKARALDNVISLPKNHVKKTNEVNSNAKVLRFPKNSN